VETDVKPLVSGTSWREAQQLVLAETVTQMHLQRPKQNRVERPL
jgi:hypothetical protein